MLAGMAAISERTTRAAAFATAGLRVDPCGMAGAGACSRRSTTTCRADSAMSGRIGAGLLFNGVDWLLYAVLTPAVFRISRRFPLRREGLARRIVLHIACALGMCVAWATLGQLLRLAIFYQSHRFHGAEVLAPAGGVDLHHAAVWNRRVLRAGGDRTCARLHGTGARARDAGDSFDRAA